MGGAVTVLTATRDDSQIPSHATATGPKRASDEGNSGPKRASNDGDSGQATVAAEPSNLGKRQTHYQRVVNEASVLRGRFVENAHFVCQNCCILLQTRTVNFKAHFHSWLNG